MKFKSRKDIFFPIFIFGISILFIGLQISKASERQSLNFVDFGVLIILGVILWLHYTTKYEITKTTLKYKGGFIKGEIEIDKIREIVKGKTMWSGVRPATTTKGLIIKYNKFDDLYITPKTNDSFVKKILEINPDIIITGDKKAIVK